MTDTRARVRLSSRQQRRYAEDVPRDEGCPQAHETARRPMPISRNKSVNQPSASNPSNARHIGSAHCKLTTPANRGQPPECKVCKLWQALHRTRSSSGSSQQSRNSGHGGAVLHAGQHPGSTHGNRVGGAGGSAAVGTSRTGASARPTGVGGTSTRYSPHARMHLATSLFRPSRSPNIVIRSPGGRPVTNAQQEQLRAKLRQLDPAQVCYLQLLVSFSIACNNLFSALRPVCR